MGFFFKKVGKQVVKSAKDAIVEELSTEEPDDDDDDEEENTFWERVKDMALCALIFSAGVAVGSHLPGLSNGPRGPGIHIHIK